MGVPHSPKPHRELTEFGGAYVRRRLEFSGVERLPGATLTAEEVESIPLSNRTALINTGRIELFPAIPADHPSVLDAFQRGYDQAVAERETVERITIAAPGGKFHVVEGHQITDAPVNKAEAEALVAEAAVN